MSFIPFVNSTDQQTFLTDILDALEDNVDGYVAAPANPEVSLASALAQVAQEIAVETSGFDSQIFETYGTEIAQIPRINPAAATGRATFSAKDSEGHTIRSGDFVTGQRGDDSYGFRVVNDVVIPEGSTSTQTGEVELLAVEPGEAANGLTGTLKLVDALRWVDAVTLVGETSGGVDGEQTSDYVQRLSEELQIQSPSPVVARDFEVLAKRQPGVGRVLALDNYDADSDTENAERTVSVCITDEFGEVADPAVKENLRAYLDGLRETNFVIRVFDPTYTTITVAATVTPYPGLDGASVKSFVEQALAQYLNPLSFGSTSDPDGDLRWYPETKVRLYDLAKVILNTDGVQHVTSVTINGGTSDVTLSGKVGLVRSGNHAISLGA